MAQETQKVLCLRISAESARKVLCAFSPYLVQGVLIFVNFFGDAEPVW